MHRATILIVGDDDIFCEFLGRFPSTTYLLLFGGDEEEIRLHCEMAAPQLIVACLEEVTEGLHKLLEQAVVGGAQLLEAASDSPRLSDLATETVGRSDLEAVVSSATGLLQERRRWPRVHCELRVEIDGQHLISETVAPQAIFVVTEEPLSIGQDVEVVVYAGERPLKGSGTVIRRGPGVAGRMGMVIELDEANNEGRGYLEEVVRGTIELEHLLRAGSPRTGSALASRLARRSAEQRLPEAADLNQAEAAAPADGQELTRLRAELAETRESLAHAETAKGELEGLAELKGALEQTLRRTLQELADSQERAEHVAGQLSEQESIRAALEQEKESLTVAQAVMTQKLADADVQRQRRAEEVGQLNEEVSSLRERLRGLEESRGKEQVDALEASRAELDQIKRSLLEELQHHKATLESRTHELDEATQRCKELERQVTELSEKAADQTALAQLVAERAREHEQNLDRAQREKAQLEQAKLEEGVRAQAALDALDQKLQQAEAQRERYLAETEQLSEQLEEALRKLDSAEQQRTTDQRASQAKMAAELEQLRRQLDEQKKQSSEVHARTQELTERAARADELERQLVEQRELAVRLTAQLQLTNDRFQEQQALLGNVRHDQERDELLEQARRERAKLEESLSQELARSQVMREAMERRLADSEGQRDRRRAEAEQARRELAVAKEELRVLQEMRAKEAVDLKDRRSDQEQTQRKLDEEMRLQSAELEARLHELSAARIRIEELEGLLAQQSEEAARQTAQAQLKTTQAQEQELLLEQARQERYEVEELLAQERARGQASREAAERRLADAETQRERRRAEAEQLRRELAVLREEKREFEERHAKELEEIKAAKQSELDLARHQLEDEKQRHRAELEEQGWEKTDTQRRIEELESQVAQQAEEIARQAAQAQLKVDHTAELKKLLIQARDERNVFDKAIQQERARAQFNREALERRLRQAETQRDRRQAETQQLRKELTAAREAVRAAEQQRTKDVQTVAEVFKVKASEMEESRRALEEELGDRKLELAKLALELEEVRRQLDDIESRPPTVSPAQLPSQLGGKPLFEDTATAVRCYFDGASNTDQAARVFFNQPQAQDSATPQAPPAPSGGDEAVAAATAGEAATASTTAKAEEVGPHLLQEEGPAGLPTLKDVLLPARGQTPPAHPAAEAKPGSPSPPPSPPAQPSAPSPPQRAAPPPYTLATDPIPALPVGPGAPAPSTLAPPPVRQPLLLAARSWLRSNLPWEKLRSWKIWAPAVVIVLALSFVVFLVMRPMRPRHQPDGRQATVGGPATASPDLRLVRRPDAATRADASSVPARAAPDAASTAPRAISHKRGIQKKAVDKRARRARTIELARKLIAKRLHKEARRQLTKILESDDEPRVRLLLAQSHEATGEYWAAIHHVKKALEGTDSGAEQLLDRLGTLYIKAGKKAEGCKAFRKALERKPGFGPAAQHLLASCGRRVSNPPTNKDKN